jgi:hypothetical protein
MHYTFAVKLARIADAARGLRYAHKFSPGKDLGQRAIAACIVEMDAAIKDLDEGDGLPAFDAKSYVEYLLRNS